LGRFKAAWSSGRRLPPLLLGKENVSPGPEPEKSLASKKNIPQTKVKKGGGGCENLSRLQTNAVWLGRRRRTITIGAKGRGSVACLHWILR